MTPLEMGGRGDSPHQFVLVEDQPVVVRHHAEAVPPLLVLLDVLEDVARVDDVVLQRNLQGEDRSRGSARGQLCPGELSEVHPWWAGWVFLL